jgi:hypothetical protein
MTPTTKPAADKKARQRKEHAAATLDALIEEATVDAYDESEQTAGFYTMLEDHLAMPFSTEVLGMEVTVERIDMTDDEEIVAVCARGRSRQRIRIVDLPLPNPSPKGSEWIDAYRRWARRR